MRIKIRQLIFRFLLLKLSNASCLQTSSISFRYLYFRGFVQCLKLSPNSRKKTKEIKNAILAKDRKKILKLEVKKLESIMAMVREPEDKIEDTENEEEK